MLISPRYCIDCRDVRFWSEAEKQFLAVFQNSPVPVVFVLTKLDLAVKLCLASQLMQSGGGMIDLQQMQTAAEIEARDNIKEKIQRPLEATLGTAINTETVSNTGRTISRMPRRRTVLKLNECPRSKSHQTAGRGDYESGKAQFEALVD